jgi:acyl-CoA thioester hydrolase
MFNPEKEYLAATSEQIMMHVNLESRRSSPFPTAIDSTINSLLDAHKDLPKPEQAGTIMGIRRR